MASLLLLSLAVLAVACISVQVLLHWELAWLLVWSDWGLLWGAGGGGLVVPLQKVGDAAQWLSLWLLLSLLLLLLSLSLLLWLLWLAGLLWLLLSVLVQATVVGLLGEEILLRAACTVGGGGSGSRLWVIASVGLVVVGSVGW